MVVFIHDTIVFSTGNKIISYIFAIVAILLTFWHAAVPILLIILCKHKTCHEDIKNLFYGSPIKEKLNNYFQSFVFILIIAFSTLSMATTATNNCFEGATWYLGLCTITLSWANLLRLLSKLPVIGEHVIVFTDIIVTFLKLTIFALLLVLAATIILSMTFYDADALVCYN